MGGQGCVIGWDCWVGVGGTSKQPSTIQGTAITGGALAAGQAREWFGVGKKYIWVAGI